jgi:C-terminal processing protease CtpA/Prc
MQLLAHPDALVVDLRANGGGNWQGTGVQPDVRVPARKALEVALELALVP